MRLFCGSNKYMSDDIAKLGFAMDTSGLKKGERELDNYARTGEKTERRTEKSSKGMSSSYAKLTGAIATATTAAASFMKVINVQRQFDVLNAQLITATGSAENAARAFESINQFAAKTPFNLQQATNGFTQLVNLGLTPSEAALTSYGNTASAMGKSLSQMIEAVADASTGEFERLKEFGIKSKSEGDKVSFTFQGVTKTIGKNAAEIEAFLMGIGDVNFAGAMEKRMDTLDGRMSNFGDSWNTLFLTISENGVGQAMERGVDIAISAVDELTAIIDSGQFNGVMDAVAVSWSSSFGNIATNMANMGMSIIGSLNEVGLKSVNISNVMSDSFFQFPVNVKAAVELATTELWAFAGKAQAIGKAVNDFLTPFNGVSEAEIDATLGAALTSIDATVAKSYGKIKAERDKSIERVNAEIEKVTQLRSTYEALQLSKATASTEADPLAEFKIKPEVDNTYQLWIDSITSESNIEKIKLLEAEILKVKAAMTADDLAEDIGAGKIDQLEDKIKNLKKTVTDIDIFGGVTESINTSLSAMQSMTKTGSKEYKALGVAIAATNAIQAVGAVLNQGQGDPYTAFGRMAAMAASVAALGVSVGGLSSGFEDQSAAAQASQGLNIWGDKSESVANSIDMTASATDKLVGINTDMLKALQSVQNGINKASALVGRDVIMPEVDQNGLGILSPDEFILDPMEMLGADFLGDWIGKGIGKWLGGKSKVVNEGIKILGGSFSEMMDDITIQSFQSVEYRKWKLGSKKTKTVTDDITDQVGSQFELVFKSIADSVATGAVALGFSTNEIEKAINEYNVATTTISLKGLSAEAQQKEIEAVFSRIFDGLAGEVIDFLPEMQQVGEGLGETLSRVATQVNIAEIAVESFGFTFFDKMANPEIYAKAADNLSMLTGGVESFAEKTSNFIDDFAPESVKLNLYSKSLTESLGAVGLSLPATSAGMFELMQSLDGTTKAGQEQIAALLNIQGTSKDYYNLLDEQSKSLVDLSNSIQGAIDNIYGATRESSKLSLDAALSAARMGDLSKALNLDFGNLNAKKSDFSTLVDFNIEQAITARKLEELKDLTGATVSIDDMTLTANQEQVELLTSIDKSLSSGASGGSSAMGVSGADMVNLKELLDDIKAIKFSSESTARSTASSEDDINAIRRSGLDVRVDA